MFAEVLTIGDELLTGNTVDSNSAFIAKKLTERGGYWVRRKTTVGDDVGGEIEGVIREILERKPEVLVISGGLGPTHDDVTMLAVAEALGRKLVLCEPCLERLREFYRELHERGGMIDDPNLNEARKKMAYLPEGAEPLENTEGGPHPALTSSTAVLRYSCSLECPAR